MSRRGERGVAALECALIVPLMMVLLTGVVDIASALQARAQLQEAAEEAVIVAARQPTQPDQAVQRAIDAAAPLTITADQVTITCDNSGGDKRVRVTITHEVQTIMLDAGSDGTLTIRASLTSDVLSNEQCHPS